VRSRQWTSFWRNLVGMAKPGCCCKGGAAAAAIRRPSNALIWLTRVLDGHHPLVGPLVGDPCAHARIVARVGAAPAPHRSRHSRTVADASRKPTEAAATAATARSSAARHADLRGREVGLAPPPAHPHPSAVGRCRRPGAVARRPATKSTLAATVAAA